MTLILVTFAIWVTLLLMTSQPPLPETVLLLPLATTMTTILLSIYTEQEHQHPLPLPNAMVRQRQ